MPITQEQRSKIIEGLKANKRQYEIAKELDITRSAVQHYAKQLRILATQKCPEDYFNVDAYFKSIPTI
jgi:predicted transcriptional regulator